MMLLVVIAASYGAVAGVAFRLLTDRERVRRAVNQLVARVLEFRLFLDEPSAIWRAQKGAFFANMALLRAVALPTVLMGAILAFAWMPMERRFGHGPLRIGEATIMTAHTDPVPCFAGLLFETPGVFIPRTGETVWRVRLVRELRAPLPAGVELRYPESNAWIGWFLAVSMVSGAAVSNGPKAFRRVR
jgi:hypothetical protein